MSRAGAAVAGLAVGVAAILVFFPAPRGILWDAVFDGGHAVLFAAFAAAAVAIVRRGRPGIRPYLAIGAVCVVLAVGTEVAQGFAGGDADPRDAVRDLAGTVAGMCLLAVAAPAGGGLRTAARGACVAAATALFGAAFAPVIPIALDYRARDASFPVLLPAGASWTSRFLEVDPAVAVLRVPTPDATVPRAIEVVLVPAAYAGFTLEEVVPDWTGYDRLTFPVENRTSRRVRLSIRIDDALQNGELDWIGASADLEPGPGKVEVDLGEFRTLRGDRVLDRRRMQRVVVYVASPEEPLTLRFGDIALVAAKR